MQLISTKIENFSSELKFIIDVNKTKTMEIISYSNKHSNTDFTKGFIPAIVTDTTNLNDDETKLLIPKNDKITISSNSGFVPKKNRKIQRNN